MKMISLDDASSELTSVLELGQHILIVLEKSPEWILSLRSGSLARDKQFGRKSRIKDPGP